MTEKLLRLEMIIRTKSMFVFILVSFLVTGCGDDGQDSADQESPTPSQGDTASAGDDNHSSEQGDGDQQSGGNDVDDGSDDNDTQDGGGTSDDGGDQNGETDDLQNKPEVVPCEHDVCVVDYSDILEGKAESLGNSYYACVGGVIGEMKTCPEGQSCIDGGCVDAFTEGNEKACLISPDDAMSLMYENNYGHCSANGNYSIVCRYGKVVVRRCERPCEDAEYGYVRCPQSQEDTALLYYERYINEQFSLHYAQLSDEEKMIYRSVFSAIMNHEEKYSVQNISNDSCQKVYQAFKKDAADLSGQIGKLSTKPSQEDPSILEYCDYQLNYTEKTEEQRTQDKALQKAAFELLEPLDAYTSDVEKETAVHNWMLTTIKKDSNSKTVYSAVVDHEASDKAFSDAFRYLMIRLMIPTIGVVGGAKSASWNIIRLGENYYNVNIALDRMSKCKVYDFDGEICPKYTYFNRSDEFFNQHDGTRKEEYLPEQGYPACTSDSLSFEALLGTDSFVNLLSSVYSFIGGHVVTNIDDYYLDMKNKLENIEISDYYQSVSILSLVVGESLIQQIKSLTEEDRNEHYFKELAEGKYAGYQCKIVTTTSNLEIGDGVSAAVIKTIHFISANP